MSDPQNSAAPAADPGQQNSWVSTLLKNVLLFYGINTAMKYFTGGANPSQVINENTSNSASPIVNTDKSLDNRSLSNILPGTTTFDLEVFIGDKEYPNINLARKEGQHVWSIIDQSYETAWNKPYDTTFFDFPILDRYISTNESSAYLNFYLLPHSRIRGSTVDYPHIIVPSDESAAVNHIHGAYPLVTYFAPLNAPEAVHSLLDDGEQKAIDEDAKQLYELRNTPLPHLLTKIEIKLVTDDNKYSVVALNQQPQLFHHHKPFPMHGLFHPPLYGSDFWALEKDFILLNNTNVNTNANVTIWFNVYSFFGAMMELQSSQSFKTQTDIGFQSKKDSFVFKKMLLDTNPYMIAFSFTFMLLHSLFNLLAFKNDVQFWRKNESMKGISALSMVVSFGTQIIVCLYLLDSEKTSWIILMDITMRLGLDFWRLTKAVSFEKSPTFPFFTIANKRDYDAAIEENGEKSDETKKLETTQDYDRYAVKWMSIALTPCVFGYAVYSLLYQKHRSWYSFVISTLAGSVYVFGFIMMTPQLYINYKLKSVDHLPWKALIYRAMNTFVDDVASLIIDMPMLHRIACFRDDIIFFIYLYQRWAYRVDKTRASVWIDGEEFVDKEKESVMSKVLDEDKKEVEGEGKIVELKDESDEKKNDADDSTLRKRK